MLRTNAGVVQTGRNGVNGSDLSLFVLEEIGLHAVENAQTALGNGGSVQLGFDALSGSFCAYQTHALVRKEIVEHTHGIGTAADTGNHTIRQSAFFFHQLFLDLLGDHCLKITDNGWKWMWSHD